ncbi:MAG: hypothetical protein KDD69_11700 [Bdellovibrionales bacterium]|nr:hypothetical protein [Bdellovibrionales bacterium]
MTDEVATQPTNDAPAKALNTNDAVLQRYAAAQVSAARAHASSADIRKENAKLQARLAELEARCLSDSEELERLREAQLAAEAVREELQRSIGDLEAKLGRQVAAAEQQLDELQQATAGLKQAEKENRELATRLQQQEAELHALRSARSYRLAGKIRKVLRLIPGARRVTTV